MRFSRSSLVLSVVAAALLCLAPGCPPNPQPPTPDSGDSGPGPPRPLDPVDAAPGPVVDASPEPAPSDAGWTWAGRACANLRVQGCPEGVSLVCATTVQHAIDANFTKVDARCLAGAVGKTAVRACGFVKCP